MRVDDSLPIQREAGMHIHAIVGDSKGFTCVQVFDPDLEVIGLLYEMDHPDDNHTCDQSHRDSGPKENPEQRMPLGNGHRVWMVAEPHANRSLLSLLCSVALGGSVRRRTAMLSLGVPEPAVNIPGSEAEVLHSHVVLKTEGIDRMYLKAYLQQL